jgi:3-dehydroquinate synthase
MMDGGASERSGMAEQIEVALGARSYPVIVGSGLLAGTTPFDAAKLGRRAAIITDGNVAPLYLAPLEAALGEAGVETASLILTPGEASKSFAELERILGWLLDQGIERGDSIVALGGGVIGDIAGLAASLLKRGCGLIQIPTTLLAQVDSSVGGKTAIDMPQGKNLVGAFYQPDLVLADIAMLDSLPPREMRAGYAEVVKYGLIDQPDFFAWLEENGAALLAGDEKARHQAVGECVRAKAAIVAEDEREQGRRALLNLGHTFGHGLEAAAGYAGELLHGEAVAIGMVMAFELSARLGHCPAAEVARVRDHLKNAGLPLRPADIGITLDPAEVLGHMQQDKKARTGRLTFILAKGIGKSFISDDVDMDDVKEVLESALC